MPCDVYDGSDRPRKHRVRLSRTCKLPLIRRAWERYSRQEQDLYQKTLALAMVKGFYAVLVGIYIEKTAAPIIYSRDLPERSVEFLEWHRKFLLALENMFRSLRDAYRCVPLPYWDYSTDYSRYVSQTCDSLVDCSAILTGLGGSEGIHTSVYWSDTHTVVGPCNVSPPNNASCPIAMSSLGQPCECAPCADDAS